jgi:hypothetical protein
MKPLTFAEKAMMAYLFWRHPAILELWLNFITLKNERLDNLRLIMNARLIKEDDGRNYPS